MSICKVAIIDDDEHSRNTIQETLFLSNYNYEPIVIKDPFTQVDDLVECIKQEQVEGVICDHRLSDHGLATTFTGAELIGHLYQNKIPSLLITQYAETDINVSIRKYRKSIPIILGRDELSDPDFDKIVQRGFDACSEEFQGFMSSHRRPHRTLINIIDITTDSDEDVVEVFVPSWNPYRAVRFPLSQIPEELIIFVKREINQHKEACLFACVNTGAENADDLYFTRFEIAPELNENDGLA